jgi:hypothetical protein
VIHAQELDHAYAAAEGAIGVLNIGGSTPLGLAGEVENSGLLSGVMDYRSPVGANARLVFDAGSELGTYTNGTNERHSVYSIGGYPARDSGLAYPRLGYGWRDGVQTGTVKGLDGPASEHDYEFRLRKLMNIRLDFRYLDYDDVNIPDIMLNFDGYELSAAVRFNF